MNGIKMSDCRFYVNEEERTVICVLPNTRLNFISYMYNRFMYHRNVRFKVDERELELPKQFMGKAVCSKEDEWSEETGRMIAFARAKNKFYKSFFKRANFLVNSIDKELTYMVDTFNKYGEVLNQKDSDLTAAIEARLAK